MKKGLIIAATAGILCSCSSTGQKEHVYSVFLTEPVTVDSVVSWTWNGTVESAAEVNAAFKTPGQITRIHVTEGQYVRKGELLAELDDSDYRLGVEALQIQYDQLSQEVERLRQLYESRSVSENDYEKAASGLRQLGIQLQLNKNKIEYTRLYSPMDGYVTDINFDESEMVDAGTPVMGLLSTSGMEVTVYVPDGAYSRRDDFISWSCATQQDRSTYPLRLVGISPETDGSQLHRILLAFRSGDRPAVMPGSNVAVTVTCRNASEGRFQLPPETLFTDGGRDCVWVLGDDGTVSRREVILAKDCSGGMAVVTSGLNGNEQVVRAGVTMLREGAKVKVLENASETNPGGLI